MRKMKENAFGPLSKALKYENMYFPANFPCQMEKVFSIL